MILGGGTMKSQERACGKKRKIIMVPYPAQGHVTPMIQLAYAFQSQGFDPILVTPEFIHRKIAPKINPAGGFSCMSVPDGLDRDPPHDFFAIEQAMENTMPVHLDRLVRKILEEEKGGGVACAVVDLLASWAIRVADECGVRVAGYWPVMLGAYQVIASIPDLVLSGLVSNSDGCLECMLNSKHSMSGKEAKHHQVKTMKSQERACGKKRKIIMVPYPAQGHVTPMIQLAYAFQSQGLDPILVTPEFIHSEISPKISPADGISCLSIPWLPDQDTPRDFFAIEWAMENIMPVHFDRILSNLLEEEGGGGGGGGGGGIACVMVDLLASWAIRVSDKLGVRVAGYWPAMLGVYRMVAAIPDLVLSGVVSKSGNPQIKGPICILPDKTALSAEDLPWLIGNSTARALRFKFWNRTLLRTMSLTWILVNSQPEPQCQNQQPSTHPQILPVGPLIKHMVCKTASSSFWEEDMTCLDWLDQKKPSSVIYVSFGSWVSPIGEGKIRSLALALESVGRPFLWVLGHSWLEGLPKGFEERVGERGKVVPWAPQVEVLKHEAVGCYLTHCGWNSTVEAVNCLKPMVCYPVAGDQFVNCAYIVGVWRIGVRVCGFGQKEVEDGLKQAMEDGGMKERLERAKEEIMGKEASSAAARNLIAFIDDLDHDVHDLMD